MVIPVLSVTHGQCDARPTVTFPAARHHHPLAGTKLYCLVTEVGEVGLSLILSIYKVVYISIKYFNAWYVAMCWTIFLSNLPKMRIWIGRNRTSDDVQPSIIL